MSQQLHFISLNDTFIHEIKKLFPQSIAEVGRVENIPREGHIFMSPANCLGFMDGGIDLALSRNIFPGIEIEPVVKREIRELGLLTNLGRPYLPIGSAILIPRSNSGMISAPTMFLPHNVSETRNAYWAALAAFRVFRKYYGRSMDHTLVLTSLCCGYGKMDEARSAAQIREAYDDFLSGKVPIDSSSSRTIVLQPLVNHEQPKNFDNREIQE